MARALSAALGAEGAVPTAGLPLSRLPDVPSMYLPMRPSSAPGPNPGNPMTMQTPGPPMTSASQPPPDMNVGPSGTLASPHGRSVTDPPPQVVMVGSSRGASHGTLPSENLPMFSAHGLSRRGVVPWLVIVLVVGALIAGFLLGYATARAH
jgi:hypothetical protein